MPEKPEKQRSELEEALSPDPEHYVGASVESMFRQGPLTLDDLTGGGCSDGCCDEEEWDEDE